MDADDAVAEENDGNNRLLASIAVIQVDRPDLAVTSVILPPVSPGQPDGFTNQKIAVAWTVTNVHEAATVFGDWRDRIYLSTDNVFDAQDLDLTGGGIPRSGPLEPGVSYLSTAQVELRATSGSYWLFAVTDATNTVVEADELNNPLGQRIQIAAPDYTVRNLTVSPPEVPMAAPCEAANPADCPRPTATRIGQSRLRIAPL